MSTDEMLEIAAQMRASHGPEHQRHDMWEAIATFVENAAKGRLASRLDAYMAGKQIAVAYRDADTSEPEHNCSYRDALEERWDPGQ